MQSFPPRSLLSLYYSHARIVWLDLHYSQPSTMTMASCGRTGTGRGLTIAAVTIALLLPHTCHGNSPLASIPTHHGINLDSLHLSERGGAVATRRHSWKYYRPRNALSCGELVTSASSVPTVSTSYALDPAEKYVGEDIQLEAMTKVDTTTTSRKQQGQSDGLTPTAIACESYCHRAVIFYRHYTV